ncbi:MAG: ATP-binding protein [Verrucomicrobiota bacterium]
MESTARNYFEKFTGLDAAAVLQGLPFTTPKTFENEWLDFKSGKPNALDKIWSRALGGFANNEGGVIVWGIDARKDEETGIDAAHSIIPVPNLEKFVSDLTESFRFATDPPLAKVEIKSIPLSPGSKEGFVVCYIPEGKTKPYRSEKDGKSYLMRLGDSQQELTVSMLRQLFYPRTEPRINIICKNIEPPESFSDQGEVNHNFQYGITFSLQILIKNIGERTVEHVCSGLEIDRGTLLRVGPDRGGNGWPCIRNRSKVEVLTSFLHPQLSSVDNVIVQSLDYIDDVLLTISVYLKDASPQKAKFRLMRGCEPVKCEEED